MYRKSEFHQRLRKRAEDQEFQPGADAPRRSEPLAPTIVESKAGGSNLAPIAQQRGPLRGGKYGSAGCRNIAERKSPRKADTAEGSDTLSLRNPSVKILSIASDIRKSGPERASPGKRAHCGKSRRQKFGAGRRVSELTSVSPRGPWRHRKSPRAIPMQLPVRSVPRGPRGPGPSYSDQQDHDPREGAGNQRTSPHPQRFGSQQPTGTAPIALTAAGTPIRPSIGSGNSWSA